MKEQTIKNIIDASLKKCVDRKLNKLPVQIELEMADPNQDKNEEWRIWFPIDSMVTDGDLAELEGKIGHSLPDDYKTFLKYKHFYELHISEVSFCPHPINTWKKKLTDMILNNYPPECLSEKGYLPFASFNDWGLLCFDTNRNQSDKNYPIVLWDHETEDEVQDMCKDFYELIIRLWQKEISET